MYGNTYEELTEMCTYSRHWNRCYSWLAFALTYRHDDNGHVHYRRRHNCLVHFCFKLKGTLYFLAWTRLHFINNLGHNYHFRLLQSSHLLTLHTLPTSHRRLYARTSQCSLLIQDNDHGLMQGWKQTNTKASTLSMYTV